MLKREALGDLWVFIKKPFAAVLGVVLGALCAIIATNEGLATIDPTSTVFVTILLIDFTSSESVYVTAFLRVLGTLLGLLLGAGVSFLSAFVLGEDVSNTGVYAYQLSCMAVLVFIPLIIQKKYPQYSYTCIIFIYSVTTLIFTGTSSAITIASIGAVLGGVIIATAIMWIFDYESAEVTLLNDHRKLLSYVLTMTRISIRANPTYKEDFFQILEDSKSSFSVNIDNITNYERWMKWTRRRCPFDFGALTKALRPLYHESASLFWSLCRDRVLRLDEHPTNDPRHLYCNTSEFYFDNYHKLVVSLVEAVDRIEWKLHRIFQQAPNRLLGSLKKRLVNHRVDPDGLKEESKPSQLINEILKKDAQDYIYTLIELKRRYFVFKTETHPNFAQQWLMCDYMYQLTLVLIEFVDYLLVVIDTVVDDTNKRTKLGRTARSLTIKAEAVSRDGFFYARSFDEAGAIPDNDEGWHASHPPNDDEQESDSVGSVVSSEALPRNLY
jgi:hypothetical protein